jgi:hypothetical protein
MNAKHDKVRFVVGMTRLANVFSNGEQPKRELLNEYWDRLSRLTIEQFETAVNHIIDTETFFPKPNAFLNLYKQSGEEAWQIALQSLQHTPLTYTIKPGTEPIIAAAMRAIGGANRINNEANTNPFIRKEFINAFEALSESKEKYESIGHDAKATLALVYAKAKDAR